MAVQQLSLRITLTALLTLQAAGCCIPIPRETIIRPATTLTIQGEDGAPLVGTLVRVTRLAEHPHYGQVHEEWELMSDTRGVVRLHREAEREWVMPLMIHGVGFRMWRVCVSHPDHVTQQLALAHDHTLSQEGSAAPLTVKLAKGDTSPCPVRSSEPRLRQGEVIEGAAHQASSLAPDSATP